ncbi:MAG: UDP-N-acetylmuramate dehydrogenase [Acidobacteriota bacterium]
MAIARRERVPLAQHCTLEVGGPARWMLECRDAADVRDAVLWARDRELPLLVLGGGSNVLIADRGFPGAVLRVLSSRVERVEKGAESAVLRADAGADWQQLVDLAVAEGLGGLECLAGIPGWCGAAPIQNIGAYGQEVAERLVRVHAVDRETARSAVLPAPECGFGYRQSAFKGAWRGRYVVTAIDLELPRRRFGEARYGELRRRLAARPGGPEAPLAAVRDAVLELRREKSMVLDAEDPNRRSAGSFFVNPVVSEEQAREVERRARAAGRGRELPRYAAEGGGVKLPAAWLIEEAGFGKGYGEGAAGLSTRHCLALVNRGGASARDLVARAVEIQRGVAGAFGVRLRPEPVLVGFEEDPGAAELLA